MVKNIGSSSPNPVAIDLFCGCGGLTLGLKKAGFAVIGGVDIDPLSLETYRINHNEVSLFEGNIQDIDPLVMLRSLGLRPGQLALLAGCPPCQGFSAMRTRNGACLVNDPRNDLVFDFLRYTSVMLPKAIMMENVPGLASDSRMMQLCKELKALNYFVQCKVLDAADYGVPQRRRRMILLGSRAGAVPFATQARHRRSVRDAIANLPRAGRSGDALHDLPEKRSERVLQLIRRIPQDGGSRRDAGSEFQLPCHKRCDGFKDVYGRMAWDEVAPTITGGCVNPSKGRFLHPEANRCITLREAALLQTFPPKYFFSLRRGKFPAAQMIGNALPPEFIRRHAAQISRHLLNAGAI